MILIHDRPKPGSIYITACFQIYGPQKFLMFTLPNMASVYISLHNSTTVLQISQKKTHFSSFMYCYIADNRENGFGFTLPLVWGDWKFPRERSREVAQTELYLLYVHSYTLSLEIYCTLKQKASKGNSMKSTTHLCLPQPQLIET